jgi:hypothetical protein
MNSRDVFSVAADCTDEMGGVGMASCSPSSPDADGVEAGQELKWQRFACRIN